MKLPGERNALCEFDIFQHLSAQSALAHRQKSHPQFSIAGDLIVSQDKLFTKRDLITKDVRINKTHEPV